MKKITLILLVVFAGTKIFAQVTCNNVLTVNVSGVVNSSTCVAPCDGQATASSSGATGYAWTPGNQTTPTATGLCAGTYTVYAYDATFNCGSKTVTITCPNSVNENSADISVQLFPNPVRDNLSINFSYPNGGAVKSIAVYNAIGEQVLTADYSSKSFSGQLYTGGLSNGTYFLELKDEKSSYRTKFIKK